MLCNKNLESPLVTSTTESPKIVITIPSSITLASTCTFSGTSGALNAGLTCSTPNSGIDKQYVLTNPFGTADYATSGTNLAIRVGEMTNPQVSGNAGTFTVATYLTEGGTDYLVDTGTYSSVTIVTGSLTSPTAATNSTVAYDSDTLFTFGFTPQHSVPINGLIDIHLPSTIPIASSSSLTAGCQAALGGAALASVVCQVVSSTNIRVTNLYAAASSAAVQIRFPGLRNPRNQGTSASFTITTSDSSSTLIDSLNSGFTVTMLSVSDLQSVSIQNTDTNKINGVFDPYRVVITPQTPAINGDKVLVVFPTTMDFPTLASDLSCAAGTNVVTISCTMNSATKTITAAISAFTGGTIASGTQFDFTINTIRNPISLAPTNMQNVLLVDSSDNNINTYTTASSITIQNTISADLTGQSLSQSTDVASAAATYTFTFTPTNPIPQHAKIQLVYPSAVTVPTSITCTGVSGISTGALDWATEHNTASRTLNILNGFSSTISVTSVITFQVAGITNPSTSTSNSFTLSTLTNGNYGIDTISTGLVPQLECNHPWATWLTSNKDHCLSCPSTGNIYLQGTTCKTSCDSGWTPEGGTTCIQWDSSCLTCTTTSRTEWATCDSTGSFPYFYSVNKKCYGTWPSGSFLDGAACSQCVSPCSTWTSTTYWESWDSSTATPYLQTGGTCVTTWGSSQTPVANIWTDCTSPWSTWNTGLPASWTSCTGVLLLYGTGWVGTCPTNTLRSGSTCTDCDSKCNGCTGTTTNCIQCTTGLYLHESTCQVCPTGYVGNATSGYCEASSTGTGTNTTTTTGGGNNGDYSLVPFPFIILALFFVLIALGGKLKDWDSQLLPTIIAFWGLIEFFLYITMGILAFRDHDLASIMAIWIVVWILLIIINITFILVFRKRILKDESFQYWRSVFPHTYRAVMIISIIFSFKFTRMFYSRLFGLDNFCWGFTVHGTFLHPLNITSAVNFVTWMLPICLISIVGFVGSSWGTQFYITCIEALLFLITFIVITIIEFKTATMHGYKRIEDISDVGSAPPVGENIEKARKEKILRELLGRIFGEKGFDNNNIDQCVNDERDWVHDRYSIPDRLRNPYDSDEESEMSRHPFSYPVSPRTRARIEEPSFPVPGMGLNAVDQFPDNVYCDSKPPSPLKKKKVPSSTAYTQTFAKEGLMGGAFNINEDFFDKDPHKQRRPKHRKRRNAYYNEVEAEDEDGFMNLSSKPKMLGVIYEEDEHGRKVRKSIYADSDSEYDGPDSVPITHPDSMDKMFNEHSIMGEFDKDEKGNIILLTDAKGNLVCKNGRKVNEKGYLRDRYGHILYGSKDRVRAFSQKDLDERGEIPLPYSWDRYNFNAFDVTGNIDPEELNKSISKSNEPLTDVNGYQLNRIGLLTDQNGNMISRLDGEIKLDNFQLTPEGDIPMLYTYEGRKFHIQQWMGTFDRDEDGNVVVLSQIDEEGNTKYVDKNNLEVTEKGYLWDSLGNILTKDGTIIFEKHEVNKQGEIPKILPYTKFNVDEIRGDLDKDGNGKFALIHENDKGEIMDKKNRKVNAKGYLIDNEGNILDQRGNRVFDCDLIDDTGEIPKVFRLGLLRSDSTTSLNRFLDELENIKHNLGLDEDEVDSGFEEEEKLLMETSDVENKSRHTSDNNSAMGDRPSNYNTANLDNVQRFTKKKDSNMGSSFSSDDFDLDDPEFLEAIKEKRHRRRIRKNKYKKPNKKDMMLANAYGGVPRGAKIEKNPLGSSRSSKQKMIVAGRINRGDRSIHGDSALDIRRDRPYTKSSKKTLEVDTKINFKPAEDQRRFGDSDLGLNSMHDESGLKDKSLGGTLMIDPNKDTYSQNSDRIKNPRGLKHPRGKKKRHRTKGRARRNRGREFGSVAPDNLEKVYEKNVDEFLNDSDWDIESVNNRSQASFKSARSYGDKRIRGLESIYLQRLEAGMKNKKKRKKKPRFRALQDRYLNQDEIPRDEDMTSSIFSEDKR